MCSVDLRRFACYFLLCSSRGFPILDVVFIARTIASGIVSICSTLHNSMPDMLLYLSTISLRYTTRVKWILSLFLAINFGGTVYLHPSSSFLLSCFRSELLCCLWKVIWKRRTICCYDYLLICLWIYLHVLANFQTISTVFITIICKGWTYINKGVLIEGNIVYQIGCSEFVW